MQHKATPSVHDTGKAKSIQGPVRRMIEQLLAEDKQCRQGLEGELAKGRPKGRTQSRAQGYESLKEPTEEELGREREKLKPWVELYATGEEDQKTVERD